MMPTPVALPPACQETHRFCGELPESCPLVANFPQPHPCWWLSTEEWHISRLDGRSRWWCCGTSLRYGYCAGWAKNPVGSASPSSSCLGPAVGLEPKTYGLTERPKPAWKACDRPFRLVDVEINAALLNRAALQGNHPRKCLEDHAQAGDFSEDPL